MNDTAERIQRAPRLIELLPQYNGTGTDGVSAVSGRLLLGQEVLRSDPEVARAIAELREHQVWARTHAPEEAVSVGDKRSVQLRDTEELIGWLEEEQDLIAHRRIGEVDIFIECVEPRSGQATYWYQCRLECPGDNPGDPKVTWSTPVSSPQVLRHAVDSPEAYDDAARAAMAFATTGYNEPGDPSEEDTSTFNAKSGWDMEVFQRCDRYRVTRL